MYRKSKKREWCILVCSTEQCIGKFSGGKKMLGGENADTLTVGLMYATSLPLTSPKAQHSALWALKDMSLIWIKWAKFVIKNDFSSTPIEYAQEWGNFPEYIPHHIHQTAHHNTWVSTKRSVHRRINRWFEWVRHCVWLWVIVCWLMSDFFSALPSH